MTPILESWPSMSLTNMYNVLLQVVVHTNSEEVIQSIQDRLSSICPTFSYSPVREQPSLNDCLEFMATGVVDETMRQVLIDTLDNDWDKVEDEDSYWAYGFNTKPFAPDIYYLVLDFDPIH